MGSIQSTPSGAEAVDGTSRPWEELPIDDAQDCCLGAPQLEACDTISKIPGGQGRPTYQNVKSEEAVGPYIVVRGTDELHSSGPYLADMPIKRVILTNEGDKEVCFLSLYFPGRVLVIETPALPQRKSSAHALTAVRIPDKEFTWSGARYHLTAYDGGHESKTFWGGKVYTPRWHYVQAESLGHLEHELSEVADFAALPGPRKAVARLDLLQSTASRDDIARLCLDDIELIEEPMSAANYGEPMLDGCGFISDELLRKVLNKTARADMGSRLAVQVRVVAPQLGVFKGMLMRKTGIKGVQLTKSMRKVPPSASKSAGSWAMVITKRVYPTKSSNAMAKRFSPPHQGQFTPSSRTNDEKPLNDMVSMLLEGIGVPRSVVHAYRAKPHNEHTSCVVGVADPTGELPAGTVFLTGTRLSEVFVTRFPCVKVSHGHVLSMPSAKPSSMSASAWDWLHELKFGALIFSGKGHCPLPGICADGDLDGDLFFVCWNDEVVHHVRTHRAAATDRLIKKGVIVKPEKGQSGSGISRSTKADGNGAGWMAAAQSHMTDINVLREHMTIGAKHKAWELAVKERGMAHPEAEECADAFSQAIDHGKHGPDDDKSSAVPSQVPQAASPSAGGINKAAKPGKKAPKGVPSIKQECNHHSQSSLQLSRAELESKPVQELRDMIDAHGLNVAKNTGGKKCRTKIDMIDDIVREMSTREE